MLDWLRRHFGAAEARQDSVAMPGAAACFAEGDVALRFSESLRAIAADKTVPEAPLRIVLQRLRAAATPPVALAERLDAAADALIRLRADLVRPRDDGPEFAALRARAAALIDEGQLAAAAMELQKGCEAARARGEGLRRSEAGFLADEARIDQLQMNHDAACAKFAEAARLDPDNPWIAIELGDLWIVRESLPEAAKAFAAASAAARRSGDDHGLGASFDRIGDVWRAQGDLSSALISHQAARAIAERLAQSQPDKAVWRRDLSASWEKIGDVQRAQGDLSAAQASYRAALAIVDRLAPSEPGDVGWRRDCSA